MPKYVTLTGEGLLVYYPSLSDYLDSVGGKEIRLHTATVRIPGQNPDGVQCGVADREEHHENEKQSDIFEIISLSQQRWIFECRSGDERDEWVRIIGREIKACLQGPCSGVEGDVLSRVLDPGIGNNVCVDCGDDDPEWASVNHGIVMCIECSGIHRNLGSHVSQVRSLFLDCLSEEQITRLRTVGNYSFNQEREADLGTSFKPSPRDHRDTKQKFIVRKYKDYRNSGDTLRYIV